MKNKTIHLASGSILGALLVIRCFSLWAVTCGGEAVENTSWYQSSCTNGNCMLYQAIGDYKCAAGPRYAYCDMVNAYGQACYELGYAWAFPGTCTGPGECTPTSGYGSLIPFQFPTVCSSGYDAEICPE